ncbi:hypothetical protein K4K57_005685 [Colletotrichum sp. SAR 10_99]|nr:hypothetical protein K4K57_005685 [Colletotrichum sp. SAR 10_99]
MGLFRKSSSSKQSGAKPAATTTGATAPPPTWKIPTPVFQPVVFVPRKDQVKTLDFPVSEVRAVAHDLLDDGANHWCFYLQIAPSMKRPQEQSVRIDATPSGLPGAVVPGGSKANILISLLGYEVSKQAQHVSRFAVPRGLKVENFVQAITGNGRDKYDFDASGRGCRKWTSDQIDLFFELGLLRSKSDADAGKKNILLEWKEYKPTGRQYPLDKGCYYK